MTTQSSQVNTLQSLPTPVVIIPVFNHKQHIERVIRETLNQGVSVIVVDDGSTDATSSVIAGIEGITVLRHSINKGKGQAILTGLEAAAQRREKVAITLDGDGQHSPADVESLLNAMNTNEPCIVIGKRQDMTASKNVPWTSRFGRGFSNFWVWVSGGPLVEDSQSGFRLYPVEEILNLDVKAKRYQFEVEILVKAKQQGIDIRETPVQVEYQEKGVRVSHFRPWLDFWRNSATFSRLIFARIFRIFGK